MGLNNGRLGSIGHAPYHHIHTEMVPSDICYLFFFIILITPMILALINPELPQYLIWIWIIEILLGIIITLVFDSVKMYRSSKL